jgi:outer membrane protein W
VELSVTAERNDTTFVRRIGGKEGYFQRSLTAYPLDLVGQYHFATNGHWEPFVGLGAHYNPAIDSPVGPRSAGSTTGSRGSSASAWGTC